MRLSDFEIDVMNVIWQAGQATAPDIHGEVCQSREVTYSTVKTIIDRLESKGAVKRCGQAGRTIFYQAAVGPDSIRQGLLEEFLVRVFSGDRKPLLVHLVRDEQLNEEELSYLEKLISERRGKDQP